MMEGSFFLAAMVHQFNRRAYLYEGMPLAVVHCVVAPYAHKVCDVLEIPADQGIHTVQGGQCNVSAIL